MESLVSIPAQDTKRNAFQPSGVRRKLLSSTDSLEQVMKENKKKGSEIKELNKSSFVRNWIEQQDQRISVGSDSSGDELNNFLERVKTRRAEEKRLMEAKERDQRKNLKTFLVSDSSDDSDQDAGSHDEGFHLRFLPRDDSFTPSLIRTFEKKSATDVIQRSKEVEISDDDGEENASFESLPTPPSTPIHQGAGGGRGRGKKGFQIPSSAPAKVTKERYHATHITCKDAAASFLYSLSQNPKDGPIHPEAAYYISRFKTCKLELANHLYQLFNKYVFDETLPSTMDIKFNNRMRKTAGFCYYRYNRKTQERSARIELSGKVIDDGRRLRDTMIHELCHAAAWLVTGCKGGHGPVWKSWTQKALKAFPNLPPITRCHYYEINCRYQYVCTGCGYKIGRHSKSLDINRKVCGVCMAKFELHIVKVGHEGEKHMKPVEDLQTPKPLNKFAQFVKENYGSVKNQNSGLKHCDVMKVLSTQFAELKVTGKTE
ncbi:unnamed protein product [Darwinula stevensoni]|uniref:SprT-like domain-containing protein n=1 Tax=Darwinula stevensoni TaxID=69355 RepID=A0A7R9A7G7_9CRUS|nr:unnamed protein product [Darwinula stevensoni]CAG0891745.1 unnamed protein product [Darwinula stevensoni]